VNTTKETEYIKKIREWAKDLEWGAESRGDNANRVAREMLDWANSEHTEPFDMKRAVGQQFVDSVIAALNVRPDGSGLGFGWHLVSLSFGENGSGHGVATMVFQSAMTLRQWADGKEWQGPHFVKVTVDAHTLTSFTPES